MSVQTYLDNVYTTVLKRNPHEPEFHSAIQELLESLNYLFEREPEWMNDSILERLIEPDRLISFRVTWLNDRHEVCINRGYRVQFNASLGPYKGGLRFHPSVNQSIIKFLGFEQFFKNALTTLPMGGGKGGSDFDPKGKSEREIMRFCQAFMSELYRHIGADLDVPAGDMGVGEREIGYLYGMYKKLSNIHTAGVITGKAPSTQGSLMRKEATGYGLVYFVSEMLKDAQQTWSNQRVIVSGSGNVALHAIEKAQALNALVIACSDSDGTLVDENGLDLALIKEIKEIKRGRLSLYVEAHPHATYLADAKALWRQRCSVALPCATQAEMDSDDAMALIAGGCKFIAEGANMPCTHAAIKLFHEHGVLYAPGKASNAGGVATSGLEMSQNSLRLTWSFEELDLRLKGIMQSIYAECKSHAVLYHQAHRLDVGANIASFKRIATALRAQGIV